MMMMSQTWLCSRYGTFFELMSSQIVNNDAPSHYSEREHYESNQKKKKSTREKRKVAYRARHRLLSISRDSEFIQERMLAALHDDSWTKKEWPWIPNKNCGSWYLPPQTSLSSCYFKSTDGHVGTYAISLKRLNLPLLELLHQHGGCYLVDSSVRKAIPDSFSRTIPIWACVINRIVQKYRREFDATTAEEDWDTNVYTPASMVSPEEHLEISELIESRVDLLYQSKAVVDPKHLVQLVTKPLRATWVSNGKQHQATAFDSKNNQVGIDNFFTIVCCNPSLYSEESKSNNNSNKREIQWTGDDDDNHGDNGKGYYYTPGAADDQETWARRLTPAIFFDHKEKLTNPSLTEDETDALIDTLLQVEEQRQSDIGNDDIGNDDSCSNNLKNFDKIGALNLWIGSRRSGRPPDCWDHFEAILNVTENEYPEMSQSTREQQKRCFYLQLAVAEGKRDRTELERLMPLGLVFLIHHLQQGRRALVHCAQGKDRSVAMVLALVVLVCPLVYPLHLRHGFEHWDLAAFSPITKSSGDTDERDDRAGGSYLHSGLSRALVDALLTETGKDSFLDWAHQQLQKSTNESLANKETLRIVLQLVRQDRENADPTRSTLQKLNRFFMSSSKYLASLDDAELVLSKHQKEK
jgi:tRNA A64-2'-O-ribosylphosphate transferase